MTALHLPICVAALYNFTRFDDHAGLRGPLELVCQREGVKGTVLLAGEGINGTIAGSDEAIAAVLDHIRAMPGCAPIEVKYSRAQAMPFYRMKVRLKREIVTMGEPDIDPIEGAGHYVEPDNWNALISEPGTIVIDTRNDYEVQAGSFRGAIKPATQTFRDFPSWFRENRADLLGQGTPPKIAMFCTGGIRCEKSTAFLKAEGLENVFHLKGGILRYLETVPAEDSTWEGECFVFDQRVTVGHGLVPGSYSSCHACRLPLGEEERASPLFEEGVSCPACYHQRSEAQRKGYRERHRQEALALERGEQHIGAVRSGTAACDDG